jgi:hypothetical protein
MKALCWNGKHDVLAQEVSEPKIEHPRDAIATLHPPQSLARIFICTMV